MFSDIQKRVTTIPKGSRVTIDTLLEAVGTVKPLRDSLHLGMINLGECAYYPSLMIRYGYHSRNIHNPQKFVDIYHTRLEYKHKGDKRANSLKVVVNSTYGAMKDKFNALYDPLMANNVCVTGQLLLLDLIEHLEPYADIVQLTMSV